MKITITGKTLKKLGRKAGNAAFSAAETVGAAAGKLKSKAEDSIQRARLAQAIQDLEDEIDFQLHAIGELIYATHKGTPSDSDDVQEILDYVDSLHEEIDAYRQQLKAPSAALQCGVCGAENDESSVYCQDCGHPLSRG